MQGPSSLYAPGTILREILVPPETRPVSHKVVAEVESIYNGMSRLCTELQTPEMPEFAGNHEETVPDDYYPEGWFAKHDVDSEKSYIATSKRAVASPNTKMRKASAISTRKRGIPGFANERRTAAVPDTGAAENIISAEYAQMLGLTLQGTPCIFQLGNKKIVKTLGTVTLDWAFSEDPLNKMSIAVIADGKTGVAGGTAYVWGGERAAGVWDVAAVVCLRSTGVGGVWAGRVLGGRQGERGTKGVCRVVRTRSATKTKNAGGYAQEDARRAGFADGLT
ncbi:hypothetical protein V499_00015 [Pseudogymnoascus sp. VKM F-103]|nr:hypothetical protein V499_00015 [Pseudogymnoascus sp. VKM F-103]